MQKKIIALAVASLVSGAALAQSNVTIYGAVDVSWATGSDNFTSSTKSTNVVLGNSQNGSRFGFKGVEDLGNGLSAKFRAEGGFNPDTGTSGQTGLMGRWSTVSLASTTLGEIEMGRRDTFQDQLLGSASGNGRTTVAQASAVYLDQARIGNFVAYLSPVWSGLQVKLGVSTNGADNANQEVALVPVTATTTDIAANTNLRVYTGAVHYVNGPVLLGAAYDYNKYQDRDGAGSHDAGNVWNVAGAYDFGVVRVDAAFGAYNYANVFGEAKDNRKQWTVGLAAPVGASGKVTLTYAHAKIDYRGAGVKDDKQNFWGLAYFHDLSKRTNLYAAIGKVSQDSGNQAANIATVNGLPTGYQQSINIGLRHFF